jgi:hypothetical protein
MRIVQSKNRGTRTYDRSGSVDAMTVSEVSGSTVDTVVQGRAGTPSS